MKDLDFDELDRAVNSLMTNVPKSAPPADDKEKTIDIAPTLGDDTPPPFEKIEETAAGAASEPKKEAAPDSKPQVAEKPAEQPTPGARPSAPAARRGGRFMDVVHPSADMKKPDAPRPVSRQGVTLEPLSPASTIADIVPKKRETTETPAEPEKPNENEKPAEQPKPAAAPVETPVSEKSEAPAPASDWPDPLDMMPAAPASEEKKEEPEAPASPEPEKPEPAPLTSPFLPDTKVEKRPLGGLASEDEAAVPTEEPAHAPVVADETPKTVDDPNDQLPASPTEVEPQLPEELSGDMMAVEADTTHDVLKQAHESRLDTAKPKKSETVAMPPETSETSDDDTSAPAGPTSIPQQYREEPSTGDTDNGAIYDTDTYHQPLAHPAKSKSGWMWVVWIVLILLLGAGGGALLYFLKLV